VSGDPSNDGARGSANGEAGARDFTVAQLAYDGLERGLTAA
jgi:hypothetical protein